MIALWQEGEVQVGIMGIGEPPPPPSANSIVIWLILISGQQTVVVALFLATGLECGAILSSSRWLQWSTACHIQCSRAG